MAESSDVQKHIAADAIAEAKYWIESKKDEFIKNMKADLAKKISELCKDRKANVDNILVASIVLSQNENAQSVITKIIDVNSKLKAQNIDNIILTTAFYDIDLKYLFGDNKDIEDKKFPRRLDKVTKIIETESSEGGSSETEVDFGLDWNNVNQWDWINFIEPLNINYSGDQKIKNLKGALTKFCKICYTYDAIRLAAGSSSFDSLEYDLAFPFFEDQLKSVNYTSAYGQRSMGMHYGVDLEAPGGFEIHAAADGQVVISYSASDGDGGGNRICIQYANNIAAWYMHMNDLIMKVGDKVTRGQVVGHVGCTGHCVPSDCTHLHFQINLNGNYTSSGTVDPCNYFTRLRSVPLMTCIGNLQD